VPQADVVSTLVHALKHYKANRINGESFGDFCHRKGQAEMQSIAG
jgi:sulfite reductase (ferredoxin)